MGTWGGGVSVMGTWDGGVSREWGRGVGESLVNRMWGRRVSWRRVGEYLVKRGGEGGGECLFNGNGRVSCERGWSRGVSLGWGRR
jgi:hypothetical protein